MKNIATVLMFLFAVFAICPIRAGEKTEMTNPIPACEKLIAEGLHKDALDMLMPWILNPKNAVPDKTEALDRGIFMAVTALIDLNRQAEIDAFLEQASEFHKDNWRILKRIAHIYFRIIGKNGVIVDGEFQRGSHRGGGQHASAEQHDRIRTLQLLLQAMPMAVQDSDKKEVAELFMLLADRLEQTEGWKFQILTDLTRLPDFETERFFGGNRSKAPVDDEGNPVFFYVPESFESAKSDGERWRWAMEQAVKYDPARLADVLRERASFCRSQFGEETLRNHSFFRDRRQDDRPERTASIWSLQTLGDRETIAELATGIRRFELPGEFNYISLYKRILETDKGTQKWIALENLAQVYTNRLQFDKAAGYYERLLEEFADKDDPPKGRWQNALDQIVGNWGRFEQRGSDVDGAKPFLNYVFRNGNKVELTAHEIKVPELIADIKAYLRSKPSRLDWNRTNIEQIGYRLIFPDGENKPEEIRKKYLGEKAARWFVDLKPADNHFDSAAAIPLPLKKPGAYLVKATLDGGNTQYAVVWLNGAALVQKQLDKANLYFLADAQTGQPIADARLDFFGYRMEWKSTPQPGNRRRQSNTPEWTFDEFAQKTDADGLAILPQNDKLNHFNWLVTSRCDESGFAFLGFNNIWFGERYDEQYNEVKMFVITDRPVYRPKDTVEIKTWVGTAKYDKPDENEWAGKTVAYNVCDPKGEKILEKFDVKLDAYGGFVTKLELPEDATLGVYSFNLTGPAHGGGSFRVEEYKKPEYEVSVDAPKEPVRLGETIKATISAKYYFGSPVVEATVKYKVLREKHDDAWYPIRPWDWFYGPGYGWLAYDTPWLPGWKNWGLDRPAPFWFPRPSGPPEVVAEREVRIGLDGTVDVEIDTSLAQAMFPGESQRYSITAEVVDNSRRTIVGNGTVLVSKEPFKVYAWVDRGYYEPDQKIEANFQARRLDGKPVSGDAEVKVYKITYKEPDTQRSGVSGFEAQETEIHRAKVKFDEQGQAKLSLNAGAAGQYRVSCKLDGQEGGYVFSVYDRAAVDASASLSWKFNALELIPERAEYAPGEIVALRVNSDRRDAFVLLFVKASNGVCLKPRVLRLGGKSVGVPIPVEMRDMPNFFIEAMIVTDGRVVTETREIVVPPQKRMLNVEVKPSAESYKPGVSAKVDLIVTDLAGTPATGQIVVSIYDKSVEYISGGSNVADIKEFFWKWRRHHHPRSQSNLEKGTRIFDEPDKPGMQNLGVFGGMIREEIALGINKEIANGGAFFRGSRQAMDRGEVLMETMETGMDAAPMAAAAPMMKGMPVNYGGFQSEIGTAVPEMVEPTIRKNFADTALWVGALETDKDGKATVELDMPESLTTWKINVWSMGLGTRVGHGTAEVITRKDLIIRMQTPRFLVEKDRCVFSANVHNYLPNEKEVKVVLNVKDSNLSIHDGKDYDRVHDETGKEAVLPPFRLKENEQMVKIPAGGEARVDWFVEAKAAGDATVVMKALTDEDSDAMQLTLPVYVHGMLKQEAWSGYVPYGQRELPLHSNDPLPVVAGSQEHEWVSGSIEIRVPEQRKPEQTKLTVRFSPTLAASMIDALPYLVDYPYGCTEQTLNRFLPTVIVQKILIDMNVDLAKLKDLKTNLNAQELSGDTVPGSLRDDSLKDDSLKDDSSRKRSLRSGNGVPGPVFDVDEVRAMVADGVTKLTNMQCTDGGWGWFGGYGEHSSAHLTALVVHGLVLAHDNDIAVDDAVIRSGLDWLLKYQTEQLTLLKNASLSDDEKKTKRWKSQADETDAFVLMVLKETLFRKSPPVDESLKVSLVDSKLDGNAKEVVEQALAEMYTPLFDKITDAIGEGMDKAIQELLGQFDEMSEFLWRDRAKLSLYGVAMYGIALSEIKGQDEKVAACVKMLEQYLQQDGENQTAWLNLARYSDWCWWCWHGSEFETQAYYLKLLMRTDPKSPVAPRLVKYLLNNRRHATYWNSTRDTAIVIEAFAEFLRSTGEDKPNMTVDVLVDGNVQKTVEITPENLFEIDNTLVLEDDAVTTGTHKIELRKKGRGPLYFNAYLENFTLEDPIEKTGLEVKIERRIYRLDRDESAQTQAAGGRGQVVDLKIEKYKRTPISEFKSGDLVEIELVVESKNDYESIIIEDMKAAGLEPVDLRSGYTGNELGAYVEFRDERVAMFVYRLAKGKHSVSYRLRAEQPGTFSALPTKISAMYAPELKGNSDENKIRIVD